MTRKGLLAIGGAMVLGVAAIAGLYGMEAVGRNAAEACPGSRAAIARLDPHARGEVAAFQVAKEAEDLSALAFTGADGRPATLGDYRGKVALVNLWATWCAPCRAEMPALDRLSREMGGADFAVVPINVDTGGRDRPAAFLQSIGVEALPLHADPTMQFFGELKKRGLALGLPVTMLLDRDGCRLGHMNGPAEWDGEDGRALIRAALRPA